jgi:hypothetical protein
MALARLRSTAVNSLRRVAHASGGILLSDRAHRQLLLQRARAVGELAGLEQRSLVPGLAAIVFSKDRALQLHALLDTYFRFAAHPADLTVLYTATSASHEAAYREVAEVFAAAPAAVSLVREQGGFRASLLTLLESVRQANLFFLVDDIVFIRPFDLDLARRIDPLQAVLSLRHSPHLRRSYTAGMDQAPPRFEQSRFDPALLQFQWFEQRNEWSDPWSVDGQVLSTAEVKVLSRLCDYKAPNSYEGELKGFNDLTVGRVGLCFPESCLLNLPINRVQQENGNRAGNVSPEFLLERWHTGWIIDTSPLAGLQPRSPHEEHPVVFKSRVPAGAVRR